MFQEIKPRRDEGLPQPPRRLRRHPFWVRRGASRGTPLLR